MLKKFLVVTLALVIIGFNFSALAKTVSLQELQDLPGAEGSSIDKSKILDKNHWEYKTLENVSKKYGLLLGQPGDKFDGNKSLTRNEAATILVSLEAKIQQDKIQITDVEKDHLDLLKDELSDEIKALVGRISTVETSVDSLKGSVAKLETADQSEIKTVFGKNFQLTGAFQGQYTGAIRRGADNSSFPPNFKLPFSQIGLKGTIMNNVDFLATVQPTRYYDSVTTKNMMGDFYVSVSKIPHHVICLGQSRVPIGYEGYLAPTDLDTPDRAQIARYFSDKRDLGLRLAGNWKYIDYYAGLYNGSRYNSADNNDKMDVMTWANVKPFANLPKLGNLVMGGGFAEGKGTQNYHVIGYYTGYKYKKLGLKYEYATSEGLMTSTKYAKDSEGGNVAGNVYNLAGRNASGWYVQGSYDLTPKLQMLTRFDQFDPNSEKNFKRDLNREFTVGTNYFIRGNNLKLQLDYVYVANQAYTDSQRIKALTQYSF